MNSLRFKYLVVMAIAVLGAKDVHSHRRSPILIDPSTRNVPLSVSVKPTDNGYFRITVWGHRSANDLLSAWFTYDDKNGHHLATAMRIADVATAKTKPTKTYWGVEVTVDRDTAKHCSIDIYWQEEGVPCGGGEMYRISLADWLPPSGTKH